MKVFVLENGSYSDTHVIGVFSTIAAADEMAAIFSDEPNITEFELDAQIDEVRRGAVPWFVRLHRETGDTLDVSPSDTSYGVFSAAVSEDVNKNLYTHVWATDADRAVKIAADRRRAFLALS